MDESHEIKIDRFGRVLIPQRIREALALTPGTTLSLEVHDEKLVLRPQPKEPTLIRKSGVLVVQAEALENLAGLRRRMRTSSLRRRFP